MATKKQKIGGSITSLLLLGFVVIDRMNGLAQFYEIFLAKLTVDGIRYGSLVFVVALVVGFNVWLWLPSKKRQYHPQMIFWKVFVKNFKKANQLKGEKQSHFVKASFIKAMPLLIDGVFGGAAKQEYVDSIAKQSDPALLMIEASNAVTRIMDRWFEANDVLVEKLKASTQKLEKHMRG